MWKTLLQNGSRFHGIVYEKRDKAKAFADTLDYFQENDIDDANAWENIVNGRAIVINTLPEDHPIRHATGNPVASQHQKGTRMGPSTSRKGPTDLQVLRQGLAQRTSNQDAGFRLFSQN